ncbi:flagellar hook-length control protein [Mycolicibacterium duvalii]|uniref:Uncharacterized protein n=1 Tax=Mycolicibacterium duvalii TaxID=39688 RepID=A0A7I7JVX5_9MYCO|nr:flagellar hook-length control protein [Mycolicibacterium duvalii]MCV7368538.1 flagellar hook-length control protein [Mycolicibacterium duvalii]PEG36744.1 flagellar hook-length control protein [Mycolicibacterium duvalii]BBX15232.1 hypothetical protein MDUV_00920 [Mycolicibacterium duvalii]
MTTMTPEDAIKAASSLARDIADGGLSPSDLERQAVAECRELFGTVAGPGDPLWELHRDIACQVLALDGVPSDELAEWLAVARQRAGEPVAAVVSLPLPKPDEAPVTAPEPETPASEADSPEHGGAPATGADPAPAVPSSPRPDRYDPLAGWQPGNTRRNR